MTIRKREFTKIRKYKKILNHENTKTRIHENIKVRKLLNYGNTETRIYENTKKYQIKKI